MSLKEELKNLDRIIRDADIRSRTLKASIELIDKELINIAELKNALEENVKCLKTNKVIALAAEYKKAKEDLKRVKFRVDALGKDKIHFISVLKEVEALSKQSTLSFNKIKNIGDSNVLQFKGKKNDG